MLLDIIFLAIIIACTVWGAKRGIIKTVLGLSSFIVSIIAALLLYQPFMDLIYSNPAIASVIDGFKANIVESMLPSPYYPPSPPELTDYTGKIPALFMAILGNDIISQGTEAAAYAVADAVVYLITIVIFIIAIKLLVSLLFKVFNVAAKLPVIKQANGLVGGILGLIIGVVLCWVAAAVISMFIGQGGTGWIIDSVESSRIAKHMFQTNIIFSILK